MPQLADALLRQALGNGREERMALGSGRVDAVATHDAFKAKVSLDCWRLGKHPGRAGRPAYRRRLAGLSHPRFAGNDHRRTGPARHLLGSVDRATGRLSTDVSIGGTLGQPEVSGELQLRDAQIDVYQVNLALRDLSLDATLQCRKPGDLRSIAVRRRHGEVQWQPRVAQSRALWHAACRGRTTARW